ncbi:Invasion associated protein p60 [hydrothermal vent metagenome]|uniref:Invasion associated protein p60 n=1 Tax=hydrothermal vent metagenome TaxID=652676 RepID=A0A1W1BYW1_9ZZZZ
MKRIYALLFNISIISTYSVAKTNQIDSKFKSGKHNGATSKKLSKKDKFKFEKYKIVEGDTLFTIARKHHTTISEVEIANKLEKDERLAIGRVLKVPVDTYWPEKLSKKVTKSNKDSKPNRDKTHTIESGDTLLAIALKYDTTVSELEKLNGFASDKKLKIGESIVVSKYSKKVAKSKKDVKKIASKKMTKSKKGAKRIASKKVTKSKKSAKRIASKKDKKIEKHVIKKGDTLYSIAQKNSTTVAKLKEINGLDSKVALKIGDVLLLQKIKESTKREKKRVKIASVSKTEHKKIKSKTSKKIAKKRQKIAAAKKIDKKKIKIAAKKPLRKKLVVSKKKTKKSFLESLGLGSSSLKLTYAKKQLGKRYVWGAVGPYSFDCSGFTRYVCKANGVCIPRTSIMQSKVGKRVSFENLKAGDLIFFDTSKRHRGYVNHVGIYIGNNKFIHASSAKRKVVITSLSIPFYRSRFKWGSRVKG